MIERGKDRHPRMGCLKDAVGAAIMIGSMAVVGSPLLDTNRASTDAIRIVNSETPPLPDDLLRQARSMRASFLETSEALARTGRLAGIPQQVNPSLLQLAYADIDREQARLNRINEVTTRLQKERSGGIIWRVLLGFGVMFGGAVIYKIRV